MEDTTAGPLEEAETARTPVPAARTPRPPFRTWISKLLLESLLIAFSVFFALAVDEWRDNRNALARSDVALQAIASEIVTNRTALEKARTVHTASLERLQAAIAAEQPLSAEVAYGGGISQPASLLATAWIEARNSGAVNQWPYDLLLDVSRMYDRQAFYSNLSTQLTVDLYREIRQRGAEPVLRYNNVGFAAIVNDFKNREEGLIKSADQVLARVKARLAERGVQ